MGSFVRDVIDTLKRTPKPVFKASRMDKLDELLRAEDQNASMARIGTFLEELCSDGNAMEHLTEPQRQMYYVSSFVADVVDLGFEEYYCDTRGRFAHQTLDALIKIGAVKAACLIRQANELFPNGKVPTDQTTRQSIIDQIRVETSSMFESLENQFFDCWKDTDAQCIEYIETHRSEF